MVRGPGQVKERLKPTCLLLVLLAAPPSWALHLGPVLCAFAVRSSPTRWLVGCLQGGEACTALSRRSWQGGYRQYHGVVSLLGLRVQRIHAQAGEAALAACAPALPSL